MTNIDLPLCSGLFMVCNEMTRNKPGLCAVSVSPGDGRRTMSLHLQ